MCRPLTGPCDLAESCDGVGNDCPPDSFAPPSTVCRYVEKSVDAVVLKGLARDPKDRFTTAREFAVAIEQTIGLASPSEVGEWVEAVASA